MAALSALDGSDTNVTLRCVSIGALDCESCLLLRDFEKRYDATGAKLISGCVSVDASSCAASVGNGTTVDPPPPTCFVDVDVDACNATALMPTDECLERCEHGECRGNFCLCEEGYGGDDCGEGSLKIGFKTLLIT